MKEIHDYMHHYRGYWSDGGKCRHAHRQRLARRAQLGGPSATGQDGAVLLASGKLLAALQRSAA